MIERSAERPPSQPKARQRRHPLEVTVDRLRDHYATYHDKLTGRERDDLSHVAYVLEQIAEGTRNA